MDLSDLLVSYKQVELPTYYEDTSTTVQPLIPENLIARVQDVVQKPDNKFIGWKYPELEDNPVEISDNMPTVKGSALFEQEMNRYMAAHPQDQQYRNTLTTIAKKESNFKQHAANSASSAVGWFQFIDSTRRGVMPNLTKQEFINSPQAQISAAVKLLKMNRAISNQFKNRRGLSQIQIDYGMWFSPKALRNYLDTGYSNFRDSQGTSLINVLNKVKNG